MSAIQFVKRFGVLQAKDALKTAPFETTHIATDEHGIYKIRVDDRGQAIFNRPNQEWWGLGRNYDCDLYDIHEIKDLVDALDLIRNIGDKIHDYLDGELLTFWLHGMKYSQERIIQAYNLVKAFEAGQ